MKYRQKPIEVQAFQFSKESIENYESLPEWLKEIIKPEYEIFDSNPQKAHYETIYGIKFYVFVGDWFIDGFITQILDNKEFHERFEVVDE